VLSYDLRVNGVGIDAQHAPTQPVPMIPTRRFMRWIIIEQRFPGAFHAIAEDIRRRHPSPPPCRALDKRVGPGAGRRHRSRASVQEQVNAAIKRHLTAKDLSIVYITKDAAGLRQALVSDAFSPIKYDGEKPKALLDEDQVIGALKLNLAPDKVKITPIGEVFAR
jgi:hypothetical protein